MSEGGGGSMNPMIHNNFEVSDDSDSEVSMVSPVDDAAAAGKLVIHLEKEEVIAVSKVKNQDT